MDARSAREWSSEAAARAICPNMPFLVSQNVVFQLNIITDDALYYDVDVGIFYGIRCNVI